METRTMWLRDDVRMRDRWHDSPLLALAFFIATMAFFWWGREAEAARLSQVQWATMLLFFVWLGRERILTKRITALTDAIEGLTLVVQATLSRHDEARASHERGVVPTESTR